ncbi:MAG: excinuclease ABC subunit UvrC [Candidatus Uhrbacteria bacterium]|nr:excinuclease ABC subunit UvrC [Candidatus Uhrbacteria bacterium]
MIPPSIKLKNQTLPDSPGVYLMKNEKGKVIYVGKATSIKRRVTSYFTHPHDARIQEMVSQIRVIDYIETRSVIEALIVEANLIKHYWPPFNVLQKDNKSFLYLVITKEDFPKPLLIRGTDLEEGSIRQYKAVFGPYTSAVSLRAALDLIRKIFPWSTCSSGQKRPCFYVHLKQCPGVCINAIDKQSYAKTIRDLIKFFQGKKDGLLRQYRREMNRAAKDHRFEQAAHLRNKIFALEHIQDVAILKRENDPHNVLPSVNLFGRIEGYDISHISGTSSVASMVVFENGAPAKTEYRKFRIKSVVGSNDVASIREVIIRRFKHMWRRPDLILIDGGLPQVHAVEAALSSSIPVIGLAKGEKRKRNDLVCSRENRELCHACEPYKDILIRVRDEAHRFALVYHRKLRGKGMLANGVRSRLKIGT